MYLLGMYLGDGYIVHHRRGVHRLTVTLDARYPGIVGECRAAIEAVLPHGRVGLHFRHGGTCAWVTNSSKQWPCLFPQHGPGHKHERLIALAPWQEALVSNRSDDIKRIFCDACDLLGIEWRVMNRWDISVARRASVARLDEFVGPKA